MKKTYHLIVDSNYALSNRTDTRVGEDYFPGLWGIKTQKTAILHAKNLIENGDEVLVKNYNDSRYFKASNKIIDALGLKQDKF